MAGSLSHGKFHVVVLVEVSAAAIAESIANIYNASIAQDSCPSVWKVGHVTSIFEKNDELRKGIIGHPHYYLYSTIYRRGCYSSTA